MQGEDNVTATPRRRWNLHPGHAQTPPSFKPPNSRPPCPPRTPCTPCTPFSFTSRPDFRQLCQMAQTTPRNDRPVELTIRGLILGCAITLVFTAANGFLGLKIGVTFPSSLPPAVILMALLRLL